MSIGLMGFGRIGRNVFRQLPSEGMEIGAIVDLAEPEAMAYLLKYDSIYGRYDGNVDLDGSTLVADGRRIPLVNAREPGEIDWSEYGVSTVVQATGKHRTNDWCRRHLDAGASKVILASTPENPGDMPILLTGVNNEVFTDDAEVIAMGSDTSNALAPVLQVLDEEFGVEYMYYTTVHAYTSNERLSDVPTGGFRSSRAAGENIIPSATNSAEIITHVLPQFAGKLSGMTLNVPVENGSTVDSVAMLTRDASAEAVNAAVKAAANDRFAGVLGFTDDPIVSTDVRGTTYSGIYDGLTTIVVDGNMVKTIVWFDNGWGYAARVVEALQTLTSLEVKV